MGEPAVDRILTLENKLKGGHTPMGMRSFGEQVRALRSRLSLTQEEFSSKYNIPIGNLRNWEQNSRASSPDTASRVLVSIISVDPERVAILIADAKRRAENLTQSSVGPLTECIE